MRHARADYNDLKALDEKIPADEPVFLIRGQDEFATEMVRHYISLRINEYGEADELVQLLAPFVDEMMSWPKKKKADL